MAKKIAMLSNSLWIVLSILLSLIFASIVTWIVIEKRTSQLNSAVSDEADQLMQKMVERVTLYQYGLRGARAFVLSQEDNGGLTRAAFQRYSATRDIAKEFPGSLGFGFVRRVAPAQVPQFIQQVQADNFPEFSIRQFQPHDGERYVIQYIEPIGFNRASVGNDIASEHHRRAAAQRAVESGEAQLTGPITLVQAAGEVQQSFLLLMPVYRTWVTPTSPAARWQAAIGWTFSPLTMKEILDSLQVNSENFRLRLNDATDPEKIELFYALNEHEAFGQLQQRTATVFGRTWVLELSATPLWSESWYILPPVLVFIGNLLIAAAACAIFFTLLGYWQARATLFRQASRLASFVEGSSDAIIGVDIAGSVRSWNRGAEEIFGFSEQEVCGKAVVDLLVPKGLEAEDLRLTRQMREGKREANLITHRQRKNGAKFDALMNVEPIFNDKRQVIGGSLTVRDISDIKRVEQELKSLNASLEDQVELRTKELSFSLKQNEALLELQNSILASSSLAVIATDTDGLITVFNPAAEQLLGYSAEEMIGLQTPLVFHDADELVSRALMFSQELGENILPGFDVLVVKSCRNLPNEYEWTYIHKNQSRIPVLLSVSTLRDTQGKINGYLAMAGDISQQQLDKNNLINAKVVADAANNAKSQFLANMSHEIRTPMNGVLGMLDLIKRTSLTHQQKDYLHKADSAARSLLGILNDILDFSKISANKMALDPTEFDLEDLLAELSVILAGNLNGKPVEVVFDQDLRLPDRVVADRLRLLQVLINISGNALKFTEKGHVIIRLTLQEQSTDSIVMRIEVEDTGIGMSEEQQAQLFQSFAQGEASTTRRYGGTGLGLVISKRLLELMGSELTLESKPNEGSRFWFDLTLPYQNKPFHNLAIPVDSIVSHKVLVVDDSRLLADLLRDGLMQKGWRVVAVCSAAAALEVIDDAEQSGDPFDVVLMDWNMPVVNGFEACKRIRTARSHATVPQIIMITAHERELIKETEQAGQQPYDHLIVKPVTVNKVHESLRACLVGERPVSPLPDTESSAVFAPLAGMKILVVEDNELNQQVAAELLTLAGAIVTVAACGVEGVAKVVLQQQSFDLVLMDIQMPDIDGFEATRRIRAHDSFAQLPIVAMTANASESDRQACFAAGMNDHIAKPFDMQKLIPRIRGYRELVRGDELFERPLVDQQQEETPEASGELTEPVATILARFSGNRELAARMRDRFGKEAHALIEKMDAAIHGKSQAELTSVLHSFKGVAATLGAIRLASVAANLETQGRHGEWASEETILSFRGLVDQSIVALEQLNFDSEIVKTEITLSPEQLQSLLEEIGVFLTEDNMSAMTLTEKLLAVYGSNTDVNTLYEQVESLDFSAAQRTLKIVKEVLLNGKS